MSLFKIVISFCTLLEILLFGGLLFGWSSLVYVLKESNIFAELCEDEIRTENNTEINAEPELKYDFKNGTYICEEQESRLNLIFNIAVAVGNVGILVIGVVDYKIGTKKTRAIFMTLFTIGSLSIAFTSNEWPRLILPGLLFVTIGGFSLLFTNVRVSFTLKHGSNIYLALLTGCYDSSVIMQWVVKILYENGIGMRYSYVGITILHLIIGSITTYLHPSIKTDDGRPKRQDQKDNEAEKHMVHVLEDKKFKDVQSNLNVKVGEGQHTNHTDGDNASIQDTPTTKTSLKSIICSSIFCINMCWFCLVTLRLFYFIGSINYRLDIFLRNKILVGHFTNVFAYVMLSGIVMSFLAGSLCEWQKRYFTGKGVLESRFSPNILPMCICSGLVILISALELSTNTIILYINFILIAMLRAFVFPVNMSFVAAVYPIEHVTFLLGLLAAASGIFSFLQYALFAWTEHSEMAPYHVSGCLLALGILTIGHPLNIYLHVYHRKH